MKIKGQHYRSIWVLEDGWGVRIFDQRALPWDIVHVDLRSVDQVVVAIKEMWVRGAPLLAMVGAYGLCLALGDNASDETLEKAYHILLGTRPTAVNLRWALDKIYDTAKPLQGDERVKACYDCANALCEEDIALNEAIGHHGLEIIRKISQDKQGKTVHILTHCNAGWLATVDYGTATSPIYMAHDAGIDVHVWVDETRPRNQGALLTAFELESHGVPHHVISDNVGGHLMQKGQVDLCLVGADRVTKNGDVCNKIGTYLKALAAYDNHVPFYVALPYPTIDYNLATGNDIIIEERSPDEVIFISGQTEKGNIKQVKLTQSPAFNPSFDVTPAKFVTGYITADGVWDKIPMIT